MSKTILIIGAGRSATSLINYLIENSSDLDTKVILAEKDADSARERFPDVEVVDFDIEEEGASRNLIEKSFAVVSMLPATLHHLVAGHCAASGTHLLTASYLKDDIKPFEDDFKSSGAACIMELGLDPGLDHMSAMKVLDRLKEDDSCELTGFETFTGGLLADNSEKDNPWKYKFTWNPRNVVMAGTGYVKFIQEGRYKYIPYNKLFKRTEVIHIPGNGYFEGYANRDSLKYMNLYGLEGIDTLFRGTLRRPGFCRAWNVFVELGATDDTYELEDVSKLTHRQFINSFLRYNPHDSVELKLAHYMSMGLDSEEMYRLKWLGIFDDELVGLDKGTPAQILEHILKKKWTLEPEDKDMIVMWHKFNFLKNGEPREIQSHIVVTGEDQTDTAMSKTVGLPLAMGVKLLVTGELNLTGIHLPTEPELYNKILPELEGMGFSFSERETIS